MATFEPFSWFESRLDGEIGQRPTPYYVAVWAGTPYRAIRSASLRTITNGGLLLYHWANKAGLLEQMWLLVIGERTALYFLDAAHAARAREWSAQYKPAKSGLLWPNKQDLDKILHVEGRMQIAGAVDFRMAYSDDPDWAIIDKEAATIYCWMVDRCRGDVYRWNQRFYFTERDDALLFKTKWAKAA